MNKPIPYKTDHCRRVVAFMTRGYSLTAFAGHLGVGRDTVDQWAKTHPRFGQAIRRAQAARVYYWEKRLITSERVRVTPIMFALKNACPDEWRQPAEDPAGPATIQPNHLTQEQP